MSVKRPSINDKAMFALNVPSIPQSVSAIAAKVKTGPGALVAHLAAESDAMRENDALKAELKSFEGATPARKIDPRLIEPSKWANRHNDSFSKKEFADLKAEILNAGGNVQPIKVRPLTKSTEEKYEIVFGHRRHRACLELGLSVLTIVESITDQALFQEMDRENRQRADLRPYEQGEMYRRALEEGLFSSLRNLAEAIGAQPGNVATALQIAKLPDAVLNAFPSRLDIQYRWAKPLNDLMSKEPDVLLERAQGVIKDSKKGKGLAASEVFTRLTQSMTKITVLKRDVRVAGAVVASIRQTGGRVIVEFEKGVLSDERLGQLEGVIGNLFG